MTPKKFREVLEGKYCRRLTGTLMTMGCFASPACMFSMMDWMKIEVT